MKAGAVTYVRAIEFLIHAPPAAKVAHLYGPAVRRKKFR